MSRCHSYLLLFCFIICFTFCACQSGDFFLFPINSSQSAEQEILIEESGNGMNAEENLNFNNVARFPLKFPPCLPLNDWTASVLLHHGTRRVLHDAREVLTAGDLRSEKVQISGVLATEKYMETKESSYLELTTFLGGCRQEIAGELFFLIFNATETISCHNSNCTGPVIMDKECRARVHISTFEPWKPFYVSCHSPEYFLLPWRGANF